MAQNLYGPGVRMGNWNEDIYLEEERMKDFLEKREKGQLLIQRNRRLKENLLRPMQLSITEDGYLRCGYKVMLVNPDYPETDADLVLGGDLSLCMALDEIKSPPSDQLEVPCGLSAAKTKIPVGRNTFIILSADRTAMGQVLTYGQNFCLATTGGFEDRMLYLSSDHRTLLRSSKRSWLQEVYLTDEASYLNCWQAAFLDPQFRLEYEGSPVPANAKIILNHSQTNRGLAAHRHLFLSGRFGKEVEVAAHTHLDLHRVEKPKNHWMLVTGNPRRDSSTMLDVPKPPAEDARAPDQDSQAPGQGADPGGQ
ncbi:cilia- and flagella-associated protein 161 [Mustela putorius furo]|uniref:Cilia- and flagella-associated protein 161 n=2 Tax=Mustela putorius furo TaxID=9669 RepID=A0A8U0N254_MUSPF|nr:cilia- and flagella-associated protein 161 [Mustela putorius furo]